MLRGHLSSSNSIVGGMLAHAAQLSLPVAGSCMASKSSAAKLGLEANARTALRRGGAINSVGGAGFISSCRGPSLVACVGHLAHDLQASLCAAHQSCCVLLLHALGGSPVSCLVGIASATAGKVIQTDLEGTMRSARPLGA